MLTVQDIQTAVAYRMGEDSAVSDSSESARRLSFINEAYRSIMTKGHWWFTEKKATLSSVLGKEFYSTSDGLPSDIKALLEVRVNNQRIDVVTQNQVFESDTTPYTNLSNSAFIFGSNLYFVPILSQSGSNNISLKYYCDYQKLTGNSSEILIPESYMDALVSYTSARIYLVDDMRGSASDAFEEYNELVERMVAENNRRLFSYKTSESYESTVSLF